MKNFLKVAAGVVLGLFLVVAANAAAPQLLTGPCQTPNGTTCNPVSQPQNLGDYNAIIQEIWSWASNFLIFNSVGEPQFLGASAFAANGTVATTMTSLGPVGAHTTVQEWMAVIDTAGTRVFIPCY